MKKAEISFADDVIITIVGLTATEVDGVAGISRGVADGSAELKGGKNLTKSEKLSFA